MDISPCRFDSGPRYNYPPKPHSSHLNEVFCFSEEPDAVYCNEKQIKRLSELILEGTEGIVQGCFIDGCYTRLRISDLSQLKKFSIKGEQIAI